MLDFDLNEPIVEEDNREDYEPFIGQTFASQEEAFVFYNNYAKRHGFVVRKDRSDTRHGRTIRRDFLCHRGGKQRLKVVDPSKSQRNKESSRCGCKGHMHITLKRRFDIFLEEWHVTKFVKEHNHDMVSLNEMHFLPSNRVITQEDENQILLYKDAGLSVRQIIRVMELKESVKHGELPFLERDVRNLFGRVKRMLQEDDIKNLLEYMRSAKQESPLFQYAYTIDEERKLENLFWCRAQSFDWYQKYGDVVVFDTTYKVNAYDMPCGIFVGVDNHRKTILFGCALLRNETTSTFKWLMKAFIGIMKKTPNTIITDQDPWMSEAIATEMPSTKHSFCIWHITSKFSCWFAALLRDDYQKWCGDFYSLYKITNPDEFEQNWFLMVAKYNLLLNKHIDGLYKIKVFWAPAYLRDYFFGGMITTGRSESINAFIKRFVSSHICLTEFVKQVDMAVEEINQGHLHVNLTSSHTTTSLKTKSPMEKQIFEIFTPFALKKFQEEITRASLYSIIDVRGDEFMVRYYEGERSHRVFWDGNTTTCSCKNFEFWGILCRHILRVFFHTDCFKIPSFYLPLRWCRDALQATIATQEPTEEEILMLEEIVPTCNTPVGEVLRPPQSKTKGRPKKKREKGGKEIAKKQKKSCSNCKQLGHTKPTCPHRNDGASSASKKNQKKTPDDLRLNPVFTLKF